MRESLIEIPHEKSPSGDFPRSSDLKILRWNPIQIYMQESYVTHPDIAHPFVNPSFANCERNPDLYPVGKGCLGCVPKVC